MTAREATPITAAAGTTLPSRTPSMKARSSVGTVVAPVLKPNSFGSWPVNTMIARPLRYPIRTGLESNSVIVPSRASPAATQMTPMRIVRVPASLTAALGSPGATSRGTTAAAVMGARAESGPITRFGDGPNMA
jgi:hypothetical protein